MDKAFIAGVCFQHYHPGGRETTNYYKHNQSRSGASAGAGAGTRLRGGSRRLAWRGRSSHREHGFQELGKRSASALRVRMRCKSNLGDHACECQAANGRCARRQFASK
eukprot:876265-Pleurochrysis_carterae.AAC.3